MPTAARMSDNDPHKIAEVLSLLDKVVLEMIRAQQPLTRVLESMDATTFEAVAREQKRIARHVLRPGGRH